MLIPPWSILGQTGHSLSHGFLYVICYTGHGVLKPYPMLNTRDALSVNNQNQGIVQDRLHHAPELVSCHCCPWGLSALVSIPLPDIRPYSTTKLRDLHLSGDKHSTSRYQSRTCDTKIWGTRMECCQTDNWVEPFPLATEEMMIRCRGTFLVKRKWKQLKIITLQYQSGE